MVAEGKVLDAIVNTFTGTDKKDEPCPLCGEIGGRSSWLGKTRYAGLTFEYVECVACHSLRCSPMPNGHTLAQMYSSGYFGCSLAQEGHSTPEMETALRRLTEVLGSVGEGRFLDFGCGRGQLLSLARSLGWDAVGIEYDADVAREAETLTGARVVTYPPVDLMNEGVFADVLFLGDVLEHLTDLESQLPEIIRLIKPGGLLVAAGPLEANPCLFFWVLKSVRRVLGHPDVEMPPYHVSLSTTTGQRALFARHGLETVEYVMEETHWPAPSRLTIQDAKNPRAVGLFMIRKTSRIVSRLRPRAWGNRYFFVGRIPL